MNEISIGEARVGDYALFRSGPRRIERITIPGGLMRFIQIGNGRIGGGDSWATTVADGVRTTCYLPSDLVMLKVTAALRSERTDAE